MTKRLYDSSFKDVEDENFKKLCDWRIPCEHPGCDKTFSKKSNMLQHMRSSHGGERHVCEHPGCYKVLRVVHSRHMGLYTEESVMHVSILDVTRPSLKAACSYVGSVHGGEGHACKHPGCGKTFTTKGSMLSHMRSNGGERHACEHPGCDGRSPRNATTSAHEVCTWRSRRV